VKYQKELYKLISKYLKKFNPKLLDDAELEYWLYEFQNYMDCSTKISGKSRFVGIKDVDGIKSWLCQCCKHFLFGCKINDIDLKTPDTDDAYDTYSESEEQYRETLKWKMLYYFFSYLSVRDIYVMCNYLYCIEDEITVIHLDEKIASALIKHGWQDMTAEHVRKIKNKSLAKAKNKFETGIFGDIFILLIEAGIIADENRELSYEDILIKKREAVMLSLGIEKDFITDIINNRRKNEN
jgi:hypothetical protein